MEEQRKAMEARPLIEEEMKGKVDLKWMGHAGVKIQFKDADNVQRSIYIDIWADNTDCAAQDKTSCPNDADLCLVTSGDTMTSFHAPFMIATGKKEDRKIVCTSECGLFISSVRPIAPTFYAKMQPGGTKDFGYCKVTMVHGEQSGVCQRPDGRLVPGGNGVGFVVTIPHHNLRIYHSGITSIFSDMKLINDLYKPDIAIICIGDDRGMRPTQAAYATKNFLTTPKTIFPLYLTTLPCFKEGTLENFKKACEEAGVTGKTIQNPKEFNTGKAIIE